MESVSGVGCRGLVCRRATAGETFNPETANCRRGEVQRLVRPRPRIFDRHTCSWDWVLPGIDPFIPPCSYHLNVTITLFFSRHLCMNPSLLLRK